MQPDPLIDRHVLFEPLAALGTKGLKPGDILRQNGFDPDLAKNHGPGMTWATYADLLHVLGEYLQEADFRQAGERYALSQRQTLKGRVLRHGLTSREGYFRYYGNRGDWLKPSILRIPNLRTECRILAGGDLRLCLGLTPGSAMAREFFWFCQGMASGLGGLWGNASAVTSAWWHSHGMDLDLSVVETVPPLARLRRWLGLTLTPKWLCEELFLAHQALQEKSADLENRVRELQSARQASEENRLLADMASQAKNDFLSKMNQELRTPLNGIVGLSEILAESLPAGSAREDARIILQCGESLKTVIDGILDYAQMTHAQGAPEAIQVDIQSLMRDLESCYAPKCYSKGLEFKLHCPVSLPSLESDPRRLRGILAAYLDNAVKFTDKGEVGLSVFLERQALIFQVTDTGPGMPPPQMTRLFKPFDAGDASPQRRHDGAGLGLALAAKLAETLGGSVSASSRAGEGATFSLRLVLMGLTGSIRDASPMETTENSQPDWTMAKGSVSATVAGPRSILFAEDDSINRSVTARILSKAGYQVQAARNGLEAVQLQRTRKFDAVILDIRMPVMDGLAAAKAIKRGHPDAPFLIALTANAMPADRRLCLEAGFDFFLAKPASTQELLRALDHAFQADGREIRANSGINP